MSKKTKDFFQQMSEWKVADEEAFHIKALDTLLALPSREQQLDFLQEYHFHGYYQCNEEGFSFIENQEIQSIVNEVKDSEELEDFIYAQVKEMVSRELLARKDYLKE